MSADVPAGVRKASSSGYRSYPDREPVEARDLAVGAASERAYAYDEQCGAIKFMRRGPK